MHERALAAVATMVMVATLTMVAPGLAGATPVTRLPDADLYCPGSSPVTGDWVWSAPATIWITAGDLAGHYQVLQASHYLAPGLLSAPPESLEGLLYLADYDLDFGTKAGMVDRAVTCTFVSRWDLPGTADDFTAVGPVTLARVP
ncbi:MAG TPA: hypothetical protein VFO65_07160 [Acidimicrobiales bacterium]|nr:hypothetical protein [Acidimicrobiales bacterium]